MAKAFTAYRNPWIEAQPGVSLERLYGYFRDRVTPGDRMFVMRVKNGTTYLLGALTVSKVESSGRGTPSEAIGESGTGVPMADRPIPAAILESLKFNTDGSPALDADTNGRWDHRTLRRPRELHG